jgi:hypothetical protein
MSAVLAAVVAMSGSALAVASPLEPIISEPDEAPAPQRLSVSRAAKLPPVSTGAYEAAS